MQESQRVQAEVRQLRVVVHESATDDSMEREMEELRERVSTLKKELDEMQIGKVETLLEQGVLEPALGK